MGSWRDQILCEFTPRVHRLTLVADPDGLLLEEGVLEGIRDRGFELIPFEDHVAFRYAYESKFRSRWDRGEHTDLVVVLHSGFKELSSLPYDLLQTGRKLSFTLGELFPNLSYPVITTLDRGDLDSLYQAQITHVPDRIGDNATKEFVLRHVFEIAPELIKQPSDLLRVLLRRHYRKQRIPTILDERFIQVLRQNGLFKDWPLETIVPDREAFFAFLQERWPLFLDRMSGKEINETQENKTPFGIDYPGPINLPFEHDDIHIYIDNLFLEGILKSIPHENADFVSKTWAAAGVRTDPYADRLRQMKGLLDSIQNDLPEEDDRHNDWLRFAFRWAEVNVLAMDWESEPKLPKKVQQIIGKIRSQIDSSFIAWLLKRYAGLVNLPPLTPVVVHHIPRFLARIIGKDQQKKIAFVLVDGLSLDQWIVMRDVLSTQCPELRFRESAIFGWIPTITSVSRQAAFAGRPPIYFPASIQTSAKEPVLWAQFWKDQGLSQSEIAYAKGLGNSNALESEVDEFLSGPQTRAAGLVISKVDKIMHGMELGMAGMYNQVQQWTLQGYMSSLLEALIGRGFHVILSSDHGNVEAKGCGRPAEGVIADLRGERARIYPDELLRSTVKEKFPDAIMWPSIGLPENYFPLLAPERLSFVPKGQKTVAHGGITIEELIVPLIQIERKK